MKQIKKIIKIIIFFIIFCFILISLIGIGVFAYFVKDLPDPTKIDQRQVIQSTKIYDRTGQTILYDIHGEEKRTIIPFEQIPQYIKDATIIIEDDNFYHHIGIDWKGILRAILANFRGKKIAQGGSTITQQFIKNAYLGGPGAERTYTRKIKEAILALIMERKYSKDEILNSYLNQVPYGSNAYGIEAASQTFFNKSASELELAEIALLAALPQSPSYYSPYGSHLDELENRKNFILDKMISFGYITEEQANQAKEEKLKYASQINLKAHHFITMIKEYLEKKYGDLYTDINMAGLKVQTTLDWDLQQIAEEIITEKAVRNKEVYNASNAALVAIDPKTGQVLTLVGSKNYDEDQFNIATSPHRQPGSSFKPFAYATALKKGFTPETILFDLQTNFGKFGSGDYIPRNYDNKFRGPISLKNALAQSINIPAVKILYLAGIDETINLAQSMGITTLKDRQRYGLSLALGGGEVKLIDETAAYGVFATEGVKHPISIILQIEDAKGNILEKHRENSTRVLDKQTSRQINNMLSDDLARTPMFGAHSVLYLPGIPAAVKTGTTQDYADGWTIGYTPSLVTGVWAGNNDFNNKMKSGASGSSVAAPIWNKFMTEAYKLKSTNDKKENNEFVLPKNTENFTSPESITTSTKPMLDGQFTYNNNIKIDKISRKLATDLTPPDLIEEKSYQEIHSILYYVNKDDPLGNYPNKENQDSQFEEWEKSVLEWGGDQLTPPTEYDNIHTLENQPNIKIISPQENTLINQHTLTIQALAEANLGIKQLDFFINNQLINTDNTSPYLITFNILPYLLEQEEQVIKVRAYDNVLNRQEDEILIKKDF